MLVTAATSRGWVRSLRHPPSPGRRGCSSRYRWPRFHRRHQR
nr:TPA_asm: m25.1 iORF RNA 1 [Murid betaherpesvirus 1]DBA07945.1 TPA_asm: m25.1 iORF RNA 1 [Murid betaherpesvirus 1]